MPNFGTLFKENQKADLERVRSFHGVLAQRRFYLVRDTAGDRDSGTRLFRYLDVNTVRRTTCAAFSIVQIGLECFTLEHGPSCFEVRRTGAE
jgi:hypothetical protein